MLMFTYGLACRLAQCLGHWYVIIGFRCLACRTPCPGDVLGPLGRHHADTPISGDVQPLLTDRNGYLFAGSFEPCTLQ